MVAVIVILYDASFGVLALDLRFGPRGRGAFSSIVLSCSEDRMEAV
jgi:hypothetical protein